MRSKTYLWAGLAYLSLSGGIVLGQIGMGAISGTVRDASGAVIPATIVTVKNLETGASRTVTSDASGNYWALSLPVGRYEVTAEKEGFAPAVRGGINLVVGQDAVIDIALQVGGVTQKVEITAEAPLVNTTTASTTGLVNEQQIKDLPLNGRSFDNLITLNPSIANFTSYARRTGSTGTGNIFSVAGRRVEENIFLLNGIEYMGASNGFTLPGGTSGQLLGIDAIREFNVQTDAYSVENGKRSGATISVVTQSGTNQLHGTLFEFLRNSALDARNFFDYPPGLRIPPFKRNQYGVAVGGPIKKDKTFFFGNWEGFRQRLGLSNVAFVPDLNARNGYLPNPANPTQLLNIGLAPGIAPYFALWPLPNGPNLGGGVAEYFSNPVQTINEDFMTARTDQTVSAKDSFSASYTYDGGSEVTPQANVLFIQPYRNRNQVFSLQETHVFTPTTLNTFRAGYSRGMYFLDQLLGVPVPAGINPMILKQNTSNPQEALESITVGAGTQFGAASISPANGGFRDGGGVRNLFTYTDDLEIIKGVHTIAVGAWFQRLQDNATQLSTLMGAATFNSLQQFMQGQASLVTGGRSPFEEPWRMFMGAWYVQDTLKLRNLTLTAGLRHEFTNGWNASNNRAGNWIYGSDGVLLSQPRVGNSVFTTNNAKWLLDPRVGIAWDVFGGGKTVVHAGFGVFRDLLDYLVFPVTTILAHPFQLQNVTFPLQIDPTAPLPAATPTPRGIDPDAKTPTVEEYSFKIEQGVTSNLALTVAYNGSHGYHGIIIRDNNTAFPTICTATTNNCPPGLPAGTKYFPLGVRRRNPLLGSGASDWSTQGNSNYNALQFDATLRASHGLQLRSNFTWAKNLDNGSQLAPVGAYNSPGDLLDPEDPRRDRGLSSLDARRRFSFNSTYELPVGDGKTFLRGLGGLPAKLVSGWQWNTIVSVNDGFPLTPQLGFNNSRDGDSGSPDRPDLRPGGQVRIIGNPNRWFDPTIYKLPIAGTYGNVARNALPGPGLVNVDTSFFKDTTITERVKLQFRIEFFNLFNHANFGLPSPVVLNSDGSVRSTAGVITNTVITSRQIQFALKLTW